MTRFREVFQFELGFTLRNASTWVLAVLLSLFSGWILLASWDEGEILFNAPIRLAFGGAGGGIFGVLVTAGLFGAAAVRDVEAEMDQLLFTTSLSKIEYLGGRFLAALTVNAIVLLAIPLGQMAATLMINTVRPEWVGPFHIGAYFQAFPIVLIPGLLATSGFLFTIAMFARQVIPVYLGAILLFISSIVAGNYAGQIGNPLLSALADPFGLATLEGLSRRWTQAEQDTRMVGFPSALVWSRLAWIAFGVAALAVLHRWFRFGQDDGGGRRRKAQLVIPSPSHVIPSEARDLQFGAGSARDLQLNYSTRLRGYPLAPLGMTTAIPRVAGTFGRFTWMQQTLAVARRSFMEVVANRTFLVMMLLAFGLTLLWGWNVGTTVFEESSVWPVTHLVAGVALSDRNGPIIYLLIALWAGEMVWKDRNVGMAEMADAAPVSDGVALLGRFLAVVATLVVLQVVMMAAGVTLQTVQGYYRFEPALYFKMVFGITLATNALLAVLAMTIHVVVNNKYVSYALMIVALVLLSAPELVGIHHRLLVYGDDPGWTYSEMNGFGSYVSPIVWFKMYWAAWAMLLLVVSSVLWVRGREPGLRHRLSVARARFVSAATLRAAGVAVALILVLGGFIFYNTNVLNEYTTPDERGERQADYERRYKRFENAPQPAITAVRHRIELYPEERRAELTGTYQLVNRTDKAIDSVHVSTSPDVEARSFVFDRGAGPIIEDGDVGYRIFTLVRPLEPGDSLKLTFHVTRRARGFPNSGVPTDVVENGTFLDRRLLPIIGYQPQLELTDARARTKFGLAHKSLLRPATDTAALRFRATYRNEGRVRMHAIIGTAADQIAVSNGALRRTWTENGRNYSEYDSEESAVFDRLFSGRYAVRKDRWKDVELSVLHHPQHTGNLDQVIRSMKASLEYFGEQFGPYRHKQLQLVERPPYGGFGHASATLIDFTENFFIIRPSANTFDEAFYGTAHEVAHQWWGSGGGFALTRGIAFLSESMANYSATMLVEKVFGPEAARRVYDFHMDRYFTARAEIAREVPVLEVENQSYLAYRRGAIAMYTLREHIGEERINAALRRFREKARNSGPPYLTSLDLYAELRAATPDSLHTLLEDLLATVTLWDMRADKATVERSASGAYEVTLDVVGRKVRADSSGRESDVPMNDLVEVGVFAAGKDGARGEQIYLGKHHIRSGTQTIRVTVPKEPARAGVDPSRKLIERDRGNNLVDVKAGG